jgi:hypothetical protein
MRRSDDDLAPDLERVEDFHGFEHHLEIAVAAEHDAYAYRSCHALRLPMSVR